MFSAILTSHVRDLDDIEEWAKDHQQLGKVAVKAAVDLAIRISAIWAADLFVWAGMPEEKAMELVPGRHDNVG